MISIKVSIIHDSSGSPAPRAAAAESALRLELAGNGPVPLLSAYAVDTAGIAPVTPKIKSAKLNTTKTDIADCLGFISPPVGVGCLVSERDSRKNLAEMRAVQSVNLTFSPPIDYVHRRRFAEGAYCRFFDHFRPRKANRLSVNRLYLCKMPKELAKWQINGGCQRNRVRRGSQTSCPGMRQAEKVVGSGTVRNCLRECSNRQGFLWSRYCMHRLRPNITCVPSEQPQSGQFSSP